MNTLTDEEIAELKNQHFVMDRYGEVFEFNKFARAIEAAVLSKLAEQDVYPVGYAVMTPFGNVYRFANTFESAKRKQDALISKFPTKKQGGIEKLYTEDQLIAAQQRTAEACANTYRAHRNYNTAEVIDDAIRNNWREYQ